jgi:Fur family transcriptional regulator, peroxide stress response regulator
MEKNLKDFKDRLRSLGLKVTPQRVVVFQELIKRKDHPNIEGILSEVKKLFPDIGQATVYSILRLLTKNGLAQEIGTFGGIRRFDGEAKTHPHFICINCNRIDDLDVPVKRDTVNLQLLISKNTGYKVTNSFFTFYGYCPKCKGRVKKHFKNGG